MTDKSTGTARVFWTVGEDAVDVRWATGFSAPDAFAMVRVGGRNVLVVGVLEAGRARRTARGAEIVVGRGRRKFVAAEIAKVARKRGAVRLEVGPGFPLGLARELEAEGFSVDVAASPAFPERVFKNGRELAAIAESQRAAVAAVRRAEAILRESGPDADGFLRWEGGWLTSQRLRREMERVIGERGCRSDDGLIAAGGRQAAFPHEEGHGRLRAGEAIVLDVFPRSVRTGYWGDLTRTLMVGPPRNPRIAAMWRAVADAQRLAFSMIRPGATGDEIQKAVEKFFAERGFPTDVRRPGRETGLIHGVGHGVGLEIHEEPRISHGAGPLEAGHVVTVEPGLYDPAVGGVRIEDTVLVTPGGPRFFARLHRILRVK